MRSSLIPSDTPNTFKHFLLAHLTMPCIVPLCARLCDGALVRPYGLLPDLITYRCYVFVNWMKYEVKWSEVTQSCPTLWDPMDYSPPGSSVHGILQARILEWVAISLSKNTGVCCHTLLQGIFPTHGLNPGLPHCRQILYCLSQQPTNLHQN